MELVLATFNPDKARELERLLALPGVTLRPLSSFQGAVSPKETGATLLENARLKAEYAARFTGLPAIADDTGLDVDALGGRPGVQAARYAGESATYDDNVRKLLAELAGIASPRRTARFRTVIVALLPERGEVTGEGVLEGVITEQPRGTNGFGYDPVFELPELGRTLAELTAEEKNERSHRAHAAHALAEKLEKIRG
jgi:XTP/dITP diphosphohydrolase